MATQYDNRCTLSFSLRPHITKNSSSRKQSSSAPLVEQLHSRNSRHFIFSSRTSPVCVTSFWWRRCSCQLFGMRVSELSRHSRGRWVHLVLAPFSAHMSLSAMLPIQHAIALRSSSPCGALSHVLHDDVDASYLRKYIRECLPPHSELALYHKEGRQRSASWSEQCAPGSRTMDIVGVIAVEYAPFEGAKSSWFSGVVWSYRVVSPMTPLRASFQWIGCWCFWIF